VGQVGKWGKETANKPHLTKKQKGPQNIKTRGGRKKKGTLMGGHPGGGIGGPETITLSKRKRERLLCIQ